MLAEEAVWVDLLPPTVRHGCARYAVISVAPEVLLLSIFSLSSDKNSTCTSAEDFID